MQQTFSILLSRQYSYAQFDTTDLLIGFVYIQQFMIILKIYYINILLMMMVVAYMCTQDSGQLHGLHYDD